MVGMVDGRAMTLHREFAVSILVRMLVRIVRRRHSDLKRFRNGRDAVGLRSPDRRDERPEHDRHQDQPSHAQRSPIGAQGLCLARGHVECCVQWRGRDYHCLEDLVGALGVGQRQSLDEFGEITRYL